MSCKDILGSIDPCGMVNHRPSMNLAGKMVGLDLEKPIDCSQMDVMQVSLLPEVDDYSGDRKWERSTALHAYMFNEDGEREELTITFKLTSPSRPKVDKL